MNNPEVWYFNDGKVLEVYRTEKGFIDKDTGHTWTHGQFMSLVTLMCGTLIEDFGFVAKDDYDLEC